MAPTLRSRSPSSSPAVPFLRLLELAPAEMRSVSRYSSASLGSLPIAAEVPCGWSGQACLGLITLEHLVVALKPLLGDVYRLVLVFNHAPNDPGIFAVTLNDGERLIRAFRGNNYTEPNAHVIYNEHLTIAD